MGNYTCKTKGKTKDPKIYEVNGRSFVKCTNCGELIGQCDWNFDELEHEPTCPCCHQFLNLPEGW